ncbi:MAG: VCBS repeat-containing protein, partial [Planctomycetota bacterium]|nr:VCBS repeat-containing protein [Planctomycetota bacterium]
MPIHHALTALLTPLLLAGVGHEQQALRFESSGQAVGASASWGVVLGDVDGDGDVDAMVYNVGTSPTDPILTFANDGSGQFSLVDSFGGYTEEDGMALVDLDADGDLDLFLTGLGRATVFENDGSGAFTQTQQFFVNGGPEPTSTVSTGDLDGDGDPDMWVTMWSQSRVVTNNGSGTFTVNPNLVPSTLGVVTLLGDLDGDGTLDAFVVGEGPDSVWLNNGSGSFTRTPQNIGSGRGVSGELGDLDGDGDLDVVVVDLGSTSVWKNDGNGLFVDTGVRLDGDFVTVDVALGDLDLDGDLDVFMTNYGSTDSTGSFVQDPDLVWLNDGTGGLERTGQLLGDGFGAAVALDDLTGNGRLDAFVANLGTSTTEDPDAVWINYDFVVVNATRDLYYADVEDAITEAGDLDTLHLYEGAFEATGVIDGRARPLRYEAVDPIVFGKDLLFLPGDGSSFLDHQDNGHGYRIEGRVVAPADGTLIIGKLDVGHDTSVPSGDAGELLQNDAALYLYSTMTTSSGITYLRGDLSADTVSTGTDGINYVARDTDVYGDYVNAGSTIIQRGTLYIYGDLADTGSMSGDVVDTARLARGLGPQPGDGMSIGGDYTIGREASLVMPASLWRLRVGGDLDIAIDDPANFEMSEASIVLTGQSPDPTQTLEAMGDRFPIGTLRIATGATVRLLDDRVNDPGHDPGDGPEAVHVGALVVEAGASLVTDGVRVVADSATILGSVDDPGNVVVVVPCPADVNDDGRVDGGDLAAVLAAWGRDVPEVELSGDDLIDGQDLA